MNKPTDSAELRRVVLASFIGTTIEWYDFFLYGTAAALVFNRLFFPTLDPLAGTLSAYATYAVGFVARPLGGAIFGHFGDRAGRKKMLVWSLSLMGVSSTLIGLTPTYDRIGIWAPIMLTILRFCQGVAAGGEWGGAVLLAVETPLVTVEGSMARGRRWERRRGYCCRRSSLRPSRRGFRSRRS